MEIAADEFRQAVIEDNPSARDLASMLPLGIEIENCANNEKIADLPRKADRRWSRPFRQRSPRRSLLLCPWSNLALFYGSYRYSSGLIRLGRIEGGVEPFLARGEFPLSVERIS